MHDCVLVKKIKIYIKKFSSGIHQLVRHLLTFFRKTGTSSFLIGIFFAFIVWFVASIIMRSGNKKMN